MSQIAEYFRWIRANLSAAMVDHDPRACEYCSARPKMTCLDLTYASLADELVERQLRRLPGGPS